MNGLIVRSEEFRQFLVFGNPINQLERLNDWMVDELVYIDITREGTYDLLRGDHKIKSQGDIISILREISRRAFMPLTFGGRITSIDDVDNFIRNGADKIIINSAAYRGPELVTEVARKYGSQAMMVGIDVKREDHRHVVHIDQGRTPVGDDPVEYAQRMEAAGAGEILVNSIDRDGTGRGYDTEIIRRVVEAVNVPVIACGGVGVYEHFCEGIDETGASAVAAGNIFNFKENAYRRAKRLLLKSGYDVRFPYPF